MVEAMKKYIILAFSLLIASSIFGGALSKEVVEKVKQATVFILMESTNNSSINNPNGRGTCSGFVINDKGLFAIVPKLL